MMPARDIICTLYAWSCYVSQTLSIFAIDSFDHTLNPRLAKKMTQIFCEEILKNEKHVFIITHNPLVLDGLDLINEGQPLSKLRINGRFEGI